MNKKLLHDCGKNLILNTNYPEMVDILADYQDFLSNGEEIAPIKAEKNIIQILKVVLIVITPLIVAFTISISTKITPQVSLILLTIIGAVIPLITFLFLGKKVNLLSKFYETTKIENTKITILSILPILTVVLYQLVIIMILNNVSNIGILSNLGYISANIQTFISLIFTVIAVVSFYKFISKSYIYFKLYVTSMTGFIMLLQVKAINSMMSGSMTEYYLEFGYLIVLVIVVVISIITIEMKKWRE